MLQLRFIVTISVVLLATVMAEDNFGQKTNQRRFVNIEAVSVTDEGPETSPDEQKRKELMVQMLQQIDAAKIELKKCLIQELKGQQVDEVKKAAALEKLNQLSSTYVKELFPDVDQQYVFKDLQGQCACEASAEVKGVQPECSRFTQTKIQNVLGN